MDPGGVDLNPDPTFEKNPEPTFEKNPGPTFEKKKPDPTHEKHHAQFRPRTIYPQHFSFRVKVNNIGTLIELMAINIEKIV